MGYLSDIVGRKPVIYLACATVIGVYIEFMCVYDLWKVLVGGAVYGIGNGAYLSVDYALACQTIPDRSQTARFLGIWGVATFIGMCLCECVGVCCVHSVHVRVRPVEGAGRGRGVRDRQRRLPLCGLCAGVPDHPGPLTDRPLPRDLEGGQVHRCVLGCARVCLCVLMSASVTVRSSHNQDSCLSAIHECVRVR